MRGGAPESRPALVSCEMSKVVKFVHQLRVELWKNGTELVGAGEAACIKGLVRDPAAARETTVPLDLFAQVDFNGVTDILSLKVLGRIGSHCSGPNHVGATGLRFYYDGLQRPSRFALTPGLLFQ